MPPASATQGQINALKAMTVTALNDLSKVSAISQLPASWTEVDRHHHVNTFHRNYSAALRHWVRQYTAWLTINGAATPASMILDTARTKAIQVDYFTHEAVIQGVEKIIVPASRVPVSPAMHCDAQGKQLKVKAGLDLLAASIGASTRWTGEDIMVTLPMKTLEKFNFTYLSPAGISDFLSDLPRPPTSKTGIRGRRWVYIMYDLLNKLPAKSYYSLLSQWFVSVFKLPYPGATVNLQPAQAQNFTLTKIGQDYYWMPKEGFAKISVLRQLESGFASNPDYVTAYDNYVTFASIQQGDSSGIGMLAGATGSWGLVSHSQVMVETTTSIVLGTPVDRVVIAGLTYADVKWIEASAKIFAPHKRIYDLVTAQEANELQSKTADISASCLLIVGPSQLPTTAENMKSASTRVYTSEAISKKTWTPVLEALSTKGAKMVYYYGACLPPPEAFADYDFYFFGTMIWNSCPLVVPKGQKVTFRGWGKNGLESLLPSSDAATKPQIWNPEDSSKYYGQFVRSMNYVMSFWAVPPIHNVTTFANLMRPYALSAKIRIRQVYTSDEAEYVMHYEHVAEGSIPDDTLVTTNTLTAQTSLSLPPSAPPNAYASVVIKAEEATDFEGFEQ